MSIIEKEITIGENSFILTNKRALFWKEESALVLSDLHLGKTAHFRKNGIPLPDNLIQEDLKRLSQLVIHFKATKLLIVGDLIHAGKNSEFELFKEFKSEFENLEILLIKGNHDRISENHLKELGITEIHTVYKKNNLLFSHENIDSSEEFVISGHLHPGISINTPTKRNMRFPCYILTDNTLILPAFSSFTGLDTKNHPKNSKYYYFTKEGIYYFD